MTVLLHSFRYAFFAYLFLIAGYANAQSPFNVDVELVLAVDVSRSMDGDEILLQRQGYRAAFQHPDIIRAIKSGAYGRIAVTYVEWADPGRAKITVPWMIIEDEASAARFAEHLENAALTRMTRTSLGDALLFSADLIDSNSFHGVRRVIDISGDGRNNEGLSVVDARNAVTARGITINGLPILLRRNISYTTGEPVKLDVYYEDCVIGGPGSFIVSIKELSEFREAIRKKIVLEIAGLQPRLWKAQLLYRPQPRVSCTDD